jgi:hypothetical protein
MKNGFAATGKFLTPEDILILSDIRLCKPIADALSRLLGLTFQHHVEKIQEKYKLDKGKYYEVSPEGEILEPTQAQPNKTGITLH